MDTLLQDLRVGLRALRRQPGLSLVAVLSLGLGIGATATVFTWLQAFVLKPMPAVAAYDRLVTVNTRAPGGGTWSVSWGDFRDWREQSRSAELASHDMLQLGLREGEGATERVWALGVSGNYFDVLRVPAALGRTLSRQDEDAAAPVAVLGWGYWQQRFAGDSAIIGRPLSLNGQAFTVIGVAAPRFGGTVVGLSFDLYVSTSTMPLLYPWGTEFLRSRGWQSLDVFGRLADGITLTQAADEIDRVARAAGQAAGFPDHRGAVVEHISKEGASEFLGPVMYALLGVAGLVLLIACANVANLLLVRAAARRREIAVRLAVGASRRRLVRQLLTESVVLAGASGAAGLLVAFWGRDLMQVLLPAVPFPVGLDMRVDGGVLLFALGVTAAAALLFGLAPAVQASNPALVPSLKDEIGEGSGGRGRLQAALVVAQVALSLVTLVGAGLFLRSLDAGRTMDTGFANAGRVLLATTDLQLAGVSGDSAQVAVVRELLERTRALPGVEAASVGMLVPLGFGGSSSNSVRVDGYTPGPNENMSLWYNIVGADYHDVVGSRVLRGRGFTAQDEAGDAPVAVVNEAFVAKYLAGREPLGARLMYGSDTLSVVGVVQTGKYQALNEAPRPYIFRLYGPRSTPSGLTVHVRTAGDPLALVPAWRRVFQEVRADLPFLDVRTLARHTEAAFFAQKLGGYMAAAIGLLALALSAIGIYGVLSFTVSRRAREIGVRVALGAGRRDVVGMVVGRAMRLAGLGIIIGLGLSVGLGQAMRSLLLGVSPRDPLTFSGIGLLLAAVALLSAWVPARRAAAVDPTVALRSE